MYNSSHKCIIVVINDKNVNITDGCIINVVYQMIYK